MEHVERQEQPAVKVTHPHRHEAIVRSTRAVVVFLLALSGLLVLVVTVGGWSQLEGMIIVDIAIILIYFALAYYALRWNRGVLPVAATVAVFLMIFSAAAAPTWFSHTAEGFGQPALNSSLLGILTALLVPLQLALIVFAMRGFKQGWNVEVEVPAAGAQLHGA
jgi:energy-coupling factor transporter transmembrane protein EcfT